MEISNAGDLTYFVSDRTRKLVLLLADYSLYAALFGSIIFFSIVAAEYNFLTFGNFINILISAAVLGLITVGLTLAMLAGQIDLSAGGIAGLASVIVAILFLWWGWPAPLAVLGVLLVGALAGLFSSFLIIECKIYSLIATLAVIGLFTGIGMTASNNIQITISNLDLQKFLLYRGIFGIPLTVWFMLLFYVVGYVLLNHTKLGAHIYATGANHTAARLAGVPVNWVIRITLMLSGVSVALAASMVTARGNITILYGAASSNAQLQATDALIAVLLGGVSLFGGAGRIERNLVAVLFLSVLANGLTLMNMPLSGWLMARGFAFLIAVILGVLRYRLM